MVSFRDFKTRLCLHLEILSERCIDVCGEYAHRMRRPILVLSAVAILLTLRAARDSIITTKARGYLNDPYDHQGGMYNSHVGLPQGQMRGGGGWFNWSNKQSNNNARFNDNGGYSAMGYDGVRGIQSTMSSPSTVFSTAQLCDSNCHSKYVHVVDNIAMSNMLKNFGGKLSFSGEIATVTSHHNMDRVKAMLSDFGTSRTGVSKVLVVDGGHGKGSAAAIFDSALAQMASANGWAGVILYGCVRQASSLSSIQLGVLATCISPRKGNGFLCSKDPEEKHHMFPLMPRQQKMPHQQMPKRRPTLPTKQQLRRCKRFRRGNSEYTKRLHWLKQSCHVYNKFNTSHIKEDHIERRQHTR